MTESVKRLYYKRNMFIEDNLNAFVCSVVRQLLDMDRISFKKKLDKQSRISSQGHICFWQRSLLDILQCIECEMNRKYSDAEKLTQKISAGN